MTQADRVLSTPPPNTSAIEQSELREKIAREIRIAMADNPVSGTPRERRDERERIDYLHADAIMAALPHFHMGVNPSYALPNRPPIRSVALRRCAQMVRCL